MLFLQSKKLNFSQFNGFPDPPEHGEKGQWHTTASTDAKTKSKRFISLLIPFKKDKKIEVSVDYLIEKPDEISVGINIKGKRYFISFLPEVAVRKETS